MDDGVVADDGIAEEGVADALGEGDVAMGDLAGGERTDAHVALEDVVPQAVGVEAVGDGDRHPVGGIVALTLQLGDFGRSEATVCAIVFLHGGRVLSALAGLLLVFFGQLDFLEAALALLPTLAGILLHVGHLVALVDNLEAEDGLDDVLEGDDALEGAELVDDAGDLLLVLEEAVPDVGDRHFLVEERDGALDVAKGLAEVVLGEFLEGFAAEDIAGDEVLLLGIDGDAREVGELVVAVELLKGHLLGGGGGDDARRHDVVGFDIVELDDVLDNLVLVLVDDALVLTHVGHGGDLLAADGGFLLVLAGDEFGEPLDEDNHGIEDEDERADGVGRERHEVAPLVGTDGLGDDFGEDEDEDGGDGRDEAEPFGAEDLGGLLADASGADGVGDGVEGEDGGDGACVVEFVFLEQGGSLAAALLAFRLVALAGILAHGDVGEGCRHQHGFQYRTEERYQHRA